MLHKPMEEYFEKKIKFITQGGPINGILKGFDEDVEAFKILINKEEFNLNVNDVLEMIPEEESSEPNTNTNTMSNTNIIQPNSQPIPNTNTNIGHPTIQPNSQPISNTVPNTNTTISNTISNTSPYDFCLSQTDYNELLHLSFTKFGPTREEFVYCGSQNLIKLIKLHLSDTNSQIDILLGTNTLYNSIGLTLARLLLAYGFDIRVVGREENLEIVKNLFLYKQNGGIINSKIRDTAKLVINTSDSIPIDHPYPKLYSFGTIKPYSDHFIVCFGASVVDNLKGSDNYFLIDVLFVEKVYEKFKLTRESMKAVRKVSRNN